MPMVRVTDATWGRLVSLKHGMESMSDVIDDLCDYRTQYLQKILEEERARSALEADRT